MGAEKRKRIGAGLRAANLIGTATAYLMSAVMILFGKPILSCFLTGDAATVEAALAIGFRFLCVLAAFFPLLYILYITRACVQGMGDGVFPMLSSAAQLVMRVGCALFLTRLIGESGVFFGEIMAWAGADLLLVGRYFIWKGRLRNDNAYEPAGKAVHSAKTGTSGNVPFPRETGGASVCAAGWLHPV